MGNFKLGSNRPNVLKENGFLNKSPFTDNGNTMAYNNGEGDPPKKPSTQAEVDAEATQKAKNNMKLVSTETRKVEGGTEKIENFEGKGKSKGFSKDPAERAKQEQWIKDNPELHAKLLAENKAKDQKITFIPDKEPKKVEKKTYTTTETPRKKKTQDYLEGKSVKMFTPITGHRMEKLSKAISRIGGGRADVTKFGQKNRISKKDLANQIANYDKKTLADREKNTRRPSPYITTTEQQEYMDKYGQPPNKFGAGRSLLYDTKTGIGQTDASQTFRNDGQGNMQVQTLNKRNKVIESQSTSPNNDINPEKTINKANAKTLSGRETVVTTSKV